MTSTVEALNGAQQYAAVRLVAATNQTVTYFNGPLNNGVQATLTYATGALTIDSVVVAVNDYVLFSGQTLAYENGIYQCITAGATGVAAVLQRRGDFQCIEQIRLGHYVPVAAGTTYGGSMWTLVEPKPLAIGVPAVSGANNIEFTTITAGGSSLFLEVANNLSDVASAATSATNLGLGIGNSPTFTNVNAGSSGVAGYLASFPATASKGSLRVQGVANTGNTLTTISNAAMGQASVISIPDPAAATAEFVIAPAALVSGNLLQASGTAGLVVDSGISAVGVSSSVQVAMTAAQFNGMYAAPVLLVAAPGANSMLVVDSIALVMTYGSAAFAAGGVVAAQYDSTALGAGVIASTTEAAADYFATASTVFKLNPGAVLAPFTTCANKGLYLSNITQAFTTGTGSAFIVKVRYHVISTVS